MYITIYHSIQLAQEKFAEKGKIMKLKDYLKKNRYSKTAFADIIGISRVGLINIIKHKNEDIYLSTALAIELATNGQIKPVDLLPPETIRELEKHVAEKLEWDTIDDA